MNEKNSHQEMTTTLVVMTLNEVEGCREIMPQLKHYRLKPVGLFEETDWKSVLFNHSGIYSPPLGA